MDGQSIFFLLYMHIQTHVANYRKKMIMIKTQFNDIFFI